MDIKNFVECNQQMIEYVFLRRAKGHYFEIPWGDSYVVSARQMYHTAHVLDISVLRYIPVDMNARSRFP